MPLNRQIKIRQNFFRMHVRMAIPYHTAKFKSTNCVKNVVLGQTAKFNDRQYFRLYGIFVCELFGISIPTYLSMFSIVFLYLFQVEKLSQKLLLSETLAYLVKVVTLTTPTHV